jgi:hypothetical protein
MKKDMPDIYFQEEMYTIPPDTDYYRLLPCITSKIQVIREQQSLSNTPVLIIEIIGLNWHPNN